MIDVIIWVFAVLAAVTGVIGIIVAVCCCVDKEIEEDESKVQSKEVDP